MAIPGEPVRRFWKTVPPQVESRAADGSQVMQNLSDVFPRLPLSGVDAATVMYGDFRRPAVSQLTAELDDGDLAVLASAAQIVGDDGPRLLAVLSILTGASPGAYHPEGNYGIAHMTAQQLVAGGWAEPPEAIISGGAERQFEILGQYLATLDPTSTDRPASCSPCSPRASPSPVTTTPPLLSLHRSLAVAEPDPHRTRRRARLGDHAGGPPTDG